MGCRRVAPKARLLRLAVAGDRVVADPGARTPGRGAYVCGPDCARAALERNALTRAFRRPVFVPHDLVESLC